MFNKRSKAIIYGTVAACLCIGFAGRSSVMLPFEEMFRPAISEADYIVIGEIVSTAPIDSTVRERLSGLLVEEVVVGDTGVGDLIPVEWRAQTWYPGEGMVTTVTGEHLALNEMHGKKALWCLGYVHPGSNTRLVKHLCDPVVLASVSRYRVEAAVLALGHTPVLKRVRPEPADMKDRIAAVDAELGIWLEEN